MLSFVFVGVLLLRLATRKFCASLFHDPPRNTRELRLEPSWAFHGRACKTRLPILGYLKSDTLYDERRNVISEKIARRRP